MRLDLFLKVARLAPRRTGAKELIDAGGATVNGQPAKPGREVRVGDRILLRHPSRELDVEVLEVPAGRCVPKQLARTLFRVHGDRRFDLWGNEIAPRPPGAPGEGAGG